MSRELQQREKSIESGTPVLWCVSSVAQILGISAKTVHKLVREGKLPCVQVTTRERRFAPEQVQQYIESHSSGIRVDKIGAPAVSSRPKKGGDTRKTDVSRASLRKEMRSWL
ncbi:MAG: helix-turn-helix domain-containing protein [Desulfomonilaceae bacterium]